MIEGFVNDLNEPIVDLDIHISDNDLRKTEGIVDTGFNGYISIPATLIEESNWHFLGTEEYELANGDVVEEKVYLGKVIFDGDETLVFSLTNRSQDTLIGTKLLKDRTLIVDFKTAKVVIKK